MVLGNGWVDTGGPRNRPIKSYAYKAKLSQSYIKPN
jgi:hypothetical protein